MPRSLRGTAIAVVETARLEVRIRIQKLFRWRAECGGIPLRVRLEDGTRAVLMQPVPAAPPAVEPSASLSTFVGRALMLRGQSPAARRDSTGQNYRFFSEGTRSGRSRHGGNPCRSKAYSKAGGSLAAIAVVLNRLIAEERLTETSGPRRHELMNFFAHSLTRRHFDWSSPTSSIIPSRR